MRKALFVLATCLVLVLAIGHSGPAADLGVWRSCKAEYHAVKLRVVQRVYGDSPQSREALRELYDALR
jgi:hypothetical protein